MHLAARASTSAGHLPRPASSPARCLRRRRRSRYDIFQLAAFTHEKPERVERIDVLALFLFCVNEGARILGVNEAPSALFDSIERGARADCIHPLLKELVPIV